MNQTDLSVQVNSSTHCILIISLFFLYEILKVHIETYKYVSVEITRFELVTPCLQGRCSPNWAIPPGIIQIAFRLMGLNGLEPSTSRLSGVRSNQLSYKPISFSAYTW